MDTKYEIKLRKYNDLDYGFVYDVKKIVYKKYVEEFFGGWDDKVQHEMFASYINSEKDNIEIILCADEKIGFIDGKIAKNEEYSLGNICILPEFQGKGIGTSILKDIISKHKNCDITLRVFKSNPARHLYKKLGFEVFEETKTHYLMRKNKI